METALIGLVGILFGILLNEYYRRQSRIESYSSRVFDKRLEIYEGLLTEIRQQASIVNNLFENDKLSNEEKHFIAFNAGLSVMEYTDQHHLYLSDEITIHCGATFVGVSDILDANGTEQQNRVSDFNKKIRNAQRMIRKESGVEELDNLFKSITKAKYSSNIIEHFRIKKKEQEKQDRK